MPAMLRDGGLLAIFPTPPAAPLFATADFALRALGDMVAGTTAGLLSKVVIISGLAQLFCVASHSFMWQYLQPGNALIV